MHPFPAGAHPHSSEEEYYEDSDEEVLVPLEAIHAELKRPHPSAAGAQQHQQPAQQQPGAPAAQKPAAGSDGGSSDGEASSAASSGSPVCCRTLVGARHRRLTSEVHAVLTAGMELFETIGAPRRAAPRRACLPDRRLPDRRLAGRRLAWPGARRSPRRGRAHSRSSAPRAR
jgi:hypothetical protein